MIDFSEIQDVDIRDVTTWPIWFRWAIIGLIAIGVMFGGYKYFIEQQQKILVELEREEKQLRKTFLEKKALAIHLPAYSAQINEIQHRFGVVLKQLPNKTEVPALLIDISQAGLARGLRFEQFKPANSSSQPKSEEPSFYQRMPISITVTGKFHQLAEFISDLAALPRIVTVGNLVIKRQSKSQLVMSAQIYTYQYLQDNTTGEAEKKTRVQG